MTSRNNKNQLKAENIMYMIGQLTSLYDNMPQSKMKSSLRRLLNMITGGVDLKHILMKLNDNISDAAKVAKGHSNPNTDNVLMFWGKVRDIILDTYKSNKGLDND